MPLDSTSLGIARQEPSPLEPMQKFVSWVIFFMAFVKLIRVGVQKPMMGNRFGSQWTGVLQLVVVLHPGQHQYD